MESAGDAADVLPTRLLSSWMPFGMAAGEGYATVTVAVGFEGSLIRLLSQHLASPYALREGATSMIEVVLRMMGEREVGHVLEHVRAPPPDHNDFFPQNHPGAGGGGVGARGAGGGGDGAGGGRPHDAFMARAQGATDAFQTESESVTPSLCLDFSELAAESEG